VYEVYTTTTVVQAKPELLIDVRALQQKTVNFDFKTGTPEMDEIVNSLGKSLWRKIVHMVDTNQIFYRCLEEIASTPKFQNLDDVKEYVSLALKKSIGPEKMGLELIDSFNEHLNKIADMLGDRLNNEQSTNFPISNAQTQLAALRNELADTKKNMKLAENKVAVLQKEKKDLLNILDSYDAENVHKVSLMKRLTAEQENTRKLRAMIDSVFKQKIPFFTGEEQ